VSVMSGFHKDFDAMPQAADFCEEPSRTPNFDARVPPSLDSIRSHNAPFS